MITTIHIKNIGIIDDISINLEQGLNVLTGETGAGKTLIIDALGIIAGNRFSKEMIRRGEEHSYVEACIFMPEHPMAVEGNIIVSREIYANGRNMCKINGRMITVTELKEMMKDIIDIHGQKDNQVILDKASHIGYLDSYIGEEIQIKKQEYRKLYNRYCEIERELKQNYGDDIEKQRRLDLLQYQVKEIEGANLKEEEEQELEEKQKMMLNAEKIAENLQTATNAIEEGAIDAIHVTIKALEKIEDIHVQYAQKLKELKNIYYDIQEIARDIANMNEETDFDAGQIEVIEKRLDLIYDLKRKYGNQISEILAYKNSVQEEIRKIENAEEINEKLKEEQKKIEIKMKQYAMQMHEIRVKQAMQLSQRINQELQDLEMKNAKFAVHINLQEKEYNKNGLDTIEFFITTNTGEEEKALIKIASGGEMSRIMLAIKSVLADVDKVPVLIFDEIDTGISGKAAKSVADKMKKIAKNHQILCITHLASIAAKGDYNYYISKVTENERTKTKIQYLNEEETIQEIARIASGEITKIAIEHAIELRKAI